MNLISIKPCTTPEGRHEPGDVFATEDRCAQYLIEHGYARPAAGRVETAESPAAAVAENAQLATPKGRGRHRKP